MNSFFSSKRILFLILWLILINLSLSARNDIYRYHYNSRPQNTLYINLFGDVSEYSVNYEHIFFINEFVFVSCGLGVGRNEELKPWIVPFPVESYEELRIFNTLPHHITGNLGKGRHFFEFGVGSTVIDLKYLPYPILGYRIHPFNSGKINFRFTLNYPVKIPEELRKIFYVPFGFSFGYCF